MPQRLQSSTTHPIPFYMVLTSDHLTPATGLTPVVTISKDGGAFGAAAGAVTERANGWYLLAGNATDRNTTGTLLLRAAVATADDTFVQVEITAQDPFAAGVVVTTNSDKTGYALTVGEHTLNAADVQTGLTAQGYTTGRSPLLDHLDADVSTRATPAQVDTQITDALTVDTIAELAQGVPSDTPTFAAALQLLYMIVRNGVVEDGTYRKVYNDAGTCIAKWATSDDGQKFTVAKVVTGP